MQLQNKLFDFILHEGLQYIKLDSLLQFEFLDLVQRTKEITGPCSEHKQISFTNTNFYQHIALELKSVLVIGMSNAL